MSNLYRNIYREIESMSSKEIQRLKSYLLDITKKHLDIFLSPMELDISKEYDYNQHNKFISFNCYVLFKTRYEHKESIFKFHLKTDSFVSFISKNDNKCLDDIKIYLRKNKIEKILN